MRGLVGIEMQDIWNRQGGTSVLDSEVYEQ